MLGVAVGVIGRPIHHYQPFKAREHCNRLRSKLRFGNPDIGFQLSGIRGRHAGSYQCFLCLNGISRAQNDRPGCLLTTQQRTATHLTLSPIGNRMIARHHDRADRQRFVGFVEHSVQKLSDRRRVGSGGLGQPGANEVLEPTLV